MSFVNECFAWPTGTFGKGLCERADELTHGSSAFDGAARAVAELRRVWVVELAAGNLGAGVSGNVYRLLNLLVDRVLDLRSAHELKVLAEGFGSN